MRKLGGVAFITSGVLFFARSILELMAGPPPATGTEILVWASAQKHILMFVSEVLFFATVSLVPAMVALYEEVKDAHRRKAVVGCGSAAVAIAILAVTLVVHGRLIYPVFHHQVHTPEIAELVVATYYGGIHAVALIMALATFVLGLALWDRARGAAVLGLFTALLDVAAGYPDALGPTLTFACGVFFAAWFVVVGVWLVRSRSESRP